MESLKELEPEMAVALDRAQQIGQQGSVEDGVLVVDRVKSLTSQVVLCHVVLDIQGVSR